MEQGTTKLKEGDLILIKNDDAPRSHWPLGRVQKTFPGSDGRVRTAEVKTPSGTLLRPVAKLCLLEESVQTRSLLKLNNAEQCRLLRNFSRRTCFPLLSFFCVVCLVDSLVGEDGVAKN